MTTIESKGDLRGSEEKAFTAKRRQRGTSLVEILVVIVIFLIGILAVVQIFPKGFQLLLTTRNNSVATALGRDAIERMKSNPSEIPEQVLPVVYSNGVPTVDTTINPLALGPLGDTVDAQGRLYRGGAMVATDWTMASGPNVARRIVGEGARVPSPREVGSVGTGSQQYESYGGLMVLAHGPVDRNGPLVAYGNELSRTVGDPREVTTIDSAANAYPVQARNPDATTTAFTGYVETTPSSVAPYEFFVENPSLPSATLLIPATRDFARTYRVRLSATIGNTANYHRVDYLSLSLVVPALPDTVTSATPVLIRVRIADLLASTTGALGNLTFANVAPETVRVAPQYVQVQNWTCPANLPSSARDYSASNYIPMNPFEMKVVDPNLGVLLFSPAAAQGAVSRPGGVSEPLVAKVDYDVLDWRIIGEDFRVVGDETPLTGNSTPTYTYSLDLQSLKVGSSTGIDGRLNGGIFDHVNASNPANPALASYDPAPSSRDNVIVIDLTTGFEVQRYATDATVGGRTAADVGTLTEASKVLVSVDKSRGSITLRDADPTIAGLQVKLIPPTGAPIEVDSANRTFRVLYRARNEWSVQILKGASQYSVVQDFNVGPGQCLVGNGDSGTFKTRIYFPTSEVGHKVTVDRIVYLNGNNVMQTLEGQDFVIHAARPVDAVSLAYADLTDVDSTAQQFLFAVPGNQAQLIDPVTGVKGASVDVRVLWNPDAFSLASDSTTNLTRIDQWGRGWRKSTTETYLRAEESR